MKTLLALAISGIFLVIAAAITLLVIRAVRRNAAGNRQGEGGRVRNHHLMEQEVGGDRERVIAKEWPIAASTGEHSEEDASRVTAPQEAEPEAAKADEEHRNPTWDEVHREAEDAHFVAAVDAPETAEEELPNADEAACTAVHQKSEQQTEEEVRYEVGEDHVATPAETSETPEEATQTDETTPTLVQQESARGAGHEARQESEEAPQADEPSRTATQQESEQQAEDEACPQAEEPHVVITTEAPKIAEDETSQSDELPLTGTPREDDQRAREEACREAEEVPQSDKISRTAIQHGAEAEVCLDASSDFQELPVLGPSPMPRAPRQYRPVARVPVVLPVSRSRASTSVEREARDRSWLLSVRLIFEKGGFCRVSLLPRRGQGMPPQVRVSGSGDPPELVELQEEWYQDVILLDAEMGHLLREGVEWARALADGQQVRWSLSGREIYVLAPHNELAGFVSVPRMMLGEQHVVLCIPQSLEDVRAAIALTNSPEPELLESGSGVPAGWVGLRGVIPHTPVAPSAAGDILDALRPLAEIEISLEGGIKIERQTWLSGYPPRIRLRGDTGAIEVVLIDGREASLDNDGGYVVPGWDALGDHSIWCTAGSRTYSIREGTEAWEPWDAYRWSQGDPVATVVEARPAICGVLVRPQFARAASQAIVVPISNPVLIGAVPGEIYVCTPRRDINASMCVGFPGFEPVWAIPADALHCDKRRARILLVGTPHRALSVRRRVLHKRGAEGSRVAEWCAAIRLAGQKGLQTEPSRSDVADLWRAYKQMAKALWRNLG